MREVLHGAVKSIDFGGILTASGPAIADTKLELRNCRVPFTASMVENRSSTTKPLITGETFLAIAIFSNWVNLPAMVRA